MPLEPGRVTPGKFKRLLGEASRLQTWAPKSSTVSRFIWFCQWAPLRHLPIGNPSSHRDPRASNRP